jgi:hypothetical protein
MEEEKKQSSSSNSAILKNALGNHQTNKGVIKSLVPDDDNVSSENEGNDNTQNSNDNPGHTLASQIGSLSLSSINSGD